MTDKYKDEAIAKIEARLREMGLDPEQVKQALIEMVDEHTPAALNNEQVGTINTMLDAALPGDYTLIFTNNGGMMVTGNTEAENGAMMALVCMLSHLLRDPDFIDKVREAITAAKEVAERNGGRLDIDMELFDLGRGKPN